MQTIYFATKNQGKLAEIRRILSGFTLLSINDIAPELDIIEDGDTFEANAKIKAEAFCKIINAPVLADDSGLEVDFLGGAPGVLSARYLGEDMSYDIKNNHIIEQLKGVPDERRAARFVCVIAYAAPGRETITARGTIEGIIARAPQGTGGFGYDPIFYVPSLRKTTAELEPDEKNAVSHRGKALRAMRELMAGFDL